MEMAYYWIAGVPSDVLQKITGHSSATIAKYGGYFSQLVTSDLAVSGEMIGGPGIIVEIDESKFGKRKYNRRHRVEGAWVFGGIERTLAKRRFAVVVQDRSAATLLPLIRQFIHPSSIVHSDMWRAYARIGTELQMEHHTVCHEDGFISPEGIHTNTVEGLWNGFKMHIPARNRTEERLGSRLIERIWRHENAEDLWNGFLRALRDAAYD